MIDMKELTRIEYLAHKYNETNMPTYISYPTTGFWKNRVTELDFISAAHDLASPFLYFHFPYCRKACYYCVCYKSVAPDVSAWDDYIDRVMKEYNRKLDAIGIVKIRDVTQMHWGGGTPTYMTSTQIERAFTEIEKRTEILKLDTSSISIEAYPAEDMIDFEKMTLLKNLGFTEISFGIQDFDKRTQAVINRDYDRATLRRLIGQARKAGLRVHIDLCYGLPFQGQNEFEATAYEIIELNPDRIATYPYSHYPLLFPMQRLIPSASIPNSFIKVLLAKSADEIFIGNGYVKIGFDHFVKKDNVLFTKFADRSVERDFMGYSIADRRQLLGFGNSAISFFGGVFFHNIAKMEDYVAALGSNETGIDVSLSHTLSWDDRIRKKVILKQILTYMEIDKEEIEAEFNIRFESYFQNEMKKLDCFSRDGLLATQGTKISLSKYGEYFSRHIAYVFDKYYNKGN